MNFEGKIANRRERVRANLRENWQDNDDFADLWSRIRSTTTFTVKLRTDDIVHRASTEIAAMPPAVRPRIVTERADIHIDRSGVTSTVRSLGQEDMVAAPVPLPDALQYLEAETRLTRPTLSRILIDSGRLSDLLVDPQGFLEQATARISGVLTEAMVAGVTYRRDSGEFPLRPLGPTLRTRTCRDLYL